MRQVITAVDAVEGSTCGIDERRETRAELMLRIESLHYAQTQEGLVDGGEDLSVLLLTAGRGFLEASAYTSDEEDRNGHQQQHEDRQLPRDHQQGEEIDKDHHRILEEDVQSGHDRSFYLAHIIRHTGDDISASCLGEIAHRQGEHFLVQLLTQVTEHTCPDRYHVVVR